MRLFPYEKNHETSISRDLYARLIYMEVIQIFITVLCHSVGLISGAFIVLQLLQVRNCFVLLKFCI